MNLIGLEGEGIKEITETARIEDRAYQGLVYDVSRSFLWHKGKHQAIHTAGSDLTGDLDQAPHGADLLQSFPVVGTFAADL